MSVKVEQKERTRKSILGAADRLLRKRGIAGATVAEVMKGAGLTVGGFYAHFASKEELIDAALHRTAASMRERLFAKLDEKPAEDRAEVVLKRYLSPAHRDNTSDGCPLPAVIGEVGTYAFEHTPVLAEEIEAGVAELETHVTASPSLSRRHLAIGLIALMYGGLSMARALKTTPLSDEVLRACRALGRVAIRHSQETS